MKHDKTPLAPSMAFSNPFLSGSPFASSPFAPTAASSTEADVPADAPEGSYTYALVQSAPEVPADEVEIAAPAVEVTLRWGDGVLSVAHLAPPRPFWVGEAEGRDGACDFSLPAERIGATRAPLVLVEGGVIFAVILPGAAGSITLGAERVSVAEAIASGRAAPCADLPGAHRIALPIGARARLALGDLSFEIAAVHAGRPVSGKVRVDRRGLPFTALSTAIHLGLLGAMAFFMPPLALAEEQGVTDDQRYALAHAIAATAEREPAPATVKDEVVRENPTAGGGSGGQAPGEPGAMGSTTSTNKGGRFQLPGPKDNPEVRLSRAEWLREAADFGMVELLKAGSAGDPNAARSPWADLDPAGRDARFAQGSLWGDALADSAGAGGLGLTGVGESSGGKFVGVSVGRVNTIGGGEGRPGEGFGPSNRPGRGHEATGPITRVGIPGVSGRIPADAIQRIVRQNFGRFRACYESGLRANPALAGRVAVGFVIGREGAVQSAQSAGSDLPDGAVVACVVRSFYGLSFPQPEGGVVKVTYPIMFTPGS